MFLIFLFMFQRWHVLVQKGRLPVASLLQFICPYWLNRSKTAFWLPFNTSALSCFILFSRTKDKKWKLNTFHLAKLCRNIAIASNAVDVSGSFHLIFFPILIYAISCNANAPKWLSVLSVKMITKCKIWKAYQ